MKILLSYFTLLLFWQTAVSKSTLEDGEVENCKPRWPTKGLFTGESLSEDILNLALMGYASASDKLTFQKGHFSPQWRFLIHTILHCLSPKKTAWEQFSSNIATAIICLATNRTFNFSKMIFEGMVKNLDSRSKFLMYPRFIQILLNKHQRLLLPHKRTYVAPTLTQKLFSNMRRVSKGYTGVDIPLFSSMLVQGPIQQGEGSTVPVESHHTPITTPSTSQPPLSSPSRVPTPPHDSPLPGGHTPGSDEGRMQQTELMDLVIKLSDKVLALETDLQQTKKVYSTTVTKLIMKVKRLEKIVKSSKARRRAKIVVSDDEKVSEDSSKQGRMIDDIDQDAGITLVTPTKTSTQEDHPEDQLGVLSAAKVLTDVARVHTYSRRRRTVSTGSGEVSTASRIISTAEETVSTAGASMPVSTVGLVQEITSSSRASKDKGKAVITKSEPEQIASKLKERQERVGYEAAIKLQEHLNQEESQRIARDEEIALRLQEEIDATGRQRMAKKLQAKEKEKYSEVDQAKMLVDLINQRKREGQEVLEEPAKRQKIGKASGSGEEQSTEKEKEVSEELQKLLVIVPVEEVYIEALQRHKKVKQYGKEAAGVGGPERKDVKVENGEERVGGTAVVGGSGRSRMA
ncbi:hypothetical protein Tco_0064613 [Tanacetum coccineum]